MTLSMDRFDTPIQLLPKPPKLPGITEAGPGRLPLEAGQQYRFSFNMGACIGCHTCEVAYAEQNGLRPEVSWRKVGEVDGGSFPTTKRFHLSLACNHFLEPACLEGCPTGAYTKLDNGIVKHHADDCIGCQYCTWNCPYSVPALQPDRRIVTKCDMCQPRLEAGGTSACVDACPTHASGIEVVDVAAWRADRHEADGPNMPPSGLTISTTRIILPSNLPLETFASSDHDLLPEHPHWPLVWVTLLTQVAIGGSIRPAVEAVERYRSPKGSPCRTRSIGKLAPVGADRIASPAGSERRLPVRSPQLSPGASRQAAIAPPVSSEGWLRVLEVAR